MQVGVVGLGVIGRAVATNLVAAGLRTIVWNRSAPWVDELVARGAVRAESLQDVFQADVVLSVLFDDAAVREVFLESGILASAASGTIHVCMSTISTGLVQELVKAHAAHDVEYVGAPLFGRPEAAAAAKLNLVTAASPDLLDKVEPVLSILGKTWRVGTDPQIAHLAKITGNFMIACATEAMAESAALLSSHGGDPAAFFAMMTETLFAAPIYRNYSAAMTGKGAPPPGAAAGFAILRKDIGLTLGEAKTGGIQTPFAEVIEQRLKMIETKGLQDQGMAAALSKVALEKP